jgi:hypothetical protein
MAGPAAMSMITLLYPGPEERAKALGVWGGIAALGGTSGLVLSGALTDLVSWRGIFLINLPIVAVALALLPRLIPESRAPGRRRLDVPGDLQVRHPARSTRQGGHRLQELRHPPHHLQDLISDVDRGQHGRHPLAQIDQRRPPRAVPRESRLSVDILQRPPAAA